MTKERIKRLCGLFDQHNIDGYIIPSSDEYQNEYVPTSAKRLEYMTAFNGSSGVCLILKTRGLFFTDGRYLEQSKHQLDSCFFQIFDMKNILEILPSEVKGGQVIGFDPKLFTKRTLKIFDVLMLKSISENLVDKIWLAKPDLPSSEIYIYPDEFAGESYETKIENCKKVLGKHNAKALVITSPDSVCWLLNLRASDVEFSPLMLANAVIFNDKVFLFVDLARISTEVKSARRLINLKASSEFEGFLKNIEGKVLVDETFASKFIIDSIKNKENIQDPCKLLKACKNAVEIKHAVSCHIRDAVAMCEFLSFTASTNLNALSEYELGSKLSALRAQQSGYVYDSFPVICGFKENGAIIHYRAGAETAKKIQGNGLLLVDSGGQYFGCTTDITRTVTIGAPTTEEKYLYTLVLQGHIELACTKFPKNIHGANLEALARKFLWAENLDYPHSTGHGVGNYLSVHEGPQAISLKNTVALKPGMILSNEPGYYVPGKFGIRIENLMYAKECDNPDYLQFENLTHVPYAKELINFDMLERKHLEYLKHYYQKIHDSVYQLLSSDAKKWFDWQIAI
jgi:Xaa-Pro aminopeptidase